jgi:hypothetical protein
MLVLTLNYLLILFKLLNDKETAYTEKYGNKYILIFSWNNDSSSHRIKTTKLFLFTLPLAS